MQEDYGRGWTYFVVYEFMLLLHIMWFQLTLFHIFNIFDGKIKNKLSIWLFWV